jgi:hypothetical protein
VMGKKPNNLPKEIYLQIGEDCDCEELDFSSNEITWCVDKINNNDIRYVLDKRQIKEPSDG